jgi:hypothetical protein
MVCVHPSDDLKVAAEGNPEKFCDASLQALGGFDAAVQQRKGRL